jgi:ubiquinone/menaquinone biosynthesis C-methylase UbiE
MVQSKIINICNLLKFFVNFNLEQKLIFINYLVNNMTEFFSLLGKYNKVRMTHWDTIAGKGNNFFWLGKYYHKKIISIYKFLVPKNQKILEIGCSEGNLLNSLSPSFGFGVDFSEEMIKKAKSKYKDLAFINSDAHALNINENFDIIILSDLVNDLYDVQTVFRNIKKNCSPGTRIIINFYNHIWEFPLKLASKIGLSKNILQQNWLSIEDIENLMKLEGMEVVNRKKEIFVPIYIPLISELVNKYFAKIWPFKFFNLTNVVVARVVEKTSKENPSVSVIIPARNEKGHIEQILKRIPEMGAFTEIIFVEGNSTDDTYGKIEECIKQFPDKQCSLFKQTGKGKGDAVRLGFEKAKGDILMILDADITVPPEILPRFYEAIATGRGEFINGVRLVYPMEEKAMRFLNLLGNKFFSMTFSWLLGQSIKDSLCGTKVLFKKDYEKIAANRAYFGDFDPFGDFDLLFGAAKLNLKIVDLPVRYGERVYGTTNIQRWSHGLLLLRMVAFAAKRIKFI